MEKKKESADEIATNIKDLTPNPESAAEKNMARDKKNCEKLARKIAALLDEKKAQKIAILDVSAKSGVCDYFVICSARSTTLVKALGEHVDDKLAKEGIEPHGRDIDQKWAAIDYLGVIVHIFYAETRDFYNLERLWDSGENVEYLN